LTESTGLPTSTSELAIMLGKPRKYTPQSPLGLHERVDSKSYTKKLIRTAANRP